MEEKGRNLFFRYAGSHALMQHDGVFEDYKRCEVTNQKEFEWAAELESELLESFENRRLVDDNFHKLVSLIKRFKSFNGVRSLVDILWTHEKSLDTFTKLLACELLVDVVHYLRQEIATSGEQAVRVLGAIKEVANTLSRQERTIAEYYRKGMLLPDSLSDNAIVRRIEFIQASASELQVRSS